MSLRKVIVGAVAALALLGSGYYGGSQRATNKQTAHYKQVIDTTYKPEITRLTNKVGNLNTDVTNRTREIGTLATDLGDAEVLLSALPAAVEYVTQNRIAPNSMHSTFDLVEVVTDAKAHAPHGAYASDDVSNFVQQHAAYQALNDMADNLLGDISQRDAQLAATEKELEVAAKRLADCQKVKSRTPRSSGSTAAVGAPQSSRYADARAAYATAMENCTDLTYALHAGNTLSGLANALGLSWQKDIDWTHNGATNPNTLREGYSVIVHVDKTKCQKKPAGAGSQTPAMSLDDCLKDVLGGSTVADTLAEYADGYNTGAAEFGKITADLKAKPKIFVAKTAELRDLQTEVNRRDANLDLFVIAANHCKMEGDAYDQLKAIDSKYNALLANLDKAIDRLEGAQKKKELKDAVKELRGLSVEPIDVSVLAPTPSGTTADLSGLLYSKRQGKKLDEMVPLQTIADHVLTTQNPNVPVYVLRENNGMHFRYPAGQDLNLRLVELGVDSNGMLTYGNEVLFGKHKQKPADSKKATQSFDHFVDTGERIVFDFNERPGKKANKLKYASGVRVASSIPNMLGAVTGDGKLAGIITSRDHERLAITIARGVGTVALADALSGGSSVNAPDPFHGGDQP